MVRVVPSRSFGSRFSRAFQPALQESMNRFFEEEKDLKKEQRKLNQLQETASAVGAPKGVTDPTVLAQYAKEQARKEGIKSLFEGIQQSRQKPSINMFEEDKSLGENPFFQESIEQSTPGGFSDEEILQIGLQNPQAGNMLMQQKKAATKEQQTTEKNLRDKFQSDRDFEWKRAGEVLKKTDEIRDSIEEKKTAANLIKQSAASNDTSGWGAWFADVLGVEPLRKADSALLKSATKDFFINNLAKAGSRPNQWIEQQISDAMVKIGRDKESNMIVAELMDYWVDREAEKVKLIDQLEDEDRAEFGYVKGDIGKRASARMKKWEDQRRDQLMYQIQLTKEEQNPDELAVIREVPKGTPLTREKAKVFKQRYGKDAEKAAKKAGYDVEIFARIS